jgi:hypothetical protein
MATVEGYRLVRSDDYSPIDPALEGSVVTAPGTTVDASPDGVWAIEDFKDTTDHRLWIVPETRPSFEIATIHWTLLLVEWDTGDVLETRDLGLSGIKGRHAQRPRIMRLVSALDVGETRHVRRVRRPLPALGAP